MFMFFKKLFGIKNSIRNLIKFMLYKNLLFIFFCQFKKLFMFSDIF